MDIYVDTDKKYTHQALILIGSLFMALLFDLLFYKKPVGISLGLFTTILVVSTFLLVRIRNIRIDWYSFLLGGFAIGLSFLAMFRSSPILTTLNIIIVFLTYSLFIIRLAGDNLRWFTLFDYLVLPFKLAFKSVGNSFVIIKDLPARHSEIAKSPLTRQVARGSLYALPAILLFLWLFSSADLVFNKYIFDLADFFKNFDFAGHLPLMILVSMVTAGLAANLIFRRESQADTEKHKRKLSIITKILSLKRLSALLLIFAFSVVSIIATPICLIMLTILGLAIPDWVASIAIFAPPVLFILGYAFLLHRYSLSKQTVLEDSNTDKTLSCNKFTLGRWPTDYTEKTGNVITCNLRYFTWVETSIILGSICLISLAFVYLQFTYLLNGSASISAQGFTYAEYAHRGFFELLVASLFSFAILCFTSSRTVATNKLHSAVTKLLSIILIGSVAVIMVSAYKRLDIYEMAYGFTILRVYTQLFIILLGLVFFALLIKIAANRNMPWLSARTIAIVVLFIIWMNAYSPDQVIAKRNLDQYKLTHKHDVLAYNTGLSADAIDEIIVSSKLLGRETDSKYLSTDSIEHLKHRQHSDKCEPWMSYNLSKQHEIKQIESFMEDDKIGNK
jgi:hypothetical protein